MNDSDPREEGAALVFALVFLALFGLSVAALLSFSATGAMTVSRLAERDAVTYAANGSIEAGIDAIRAAADDPNFESDPASACIDPALVPQLNGVTTVVTCQVAPASGGVAIAGAMGMSGFALQASGGALAPSEAILTLAEGSEVGFAQRSSARSSSLTVQGDVVSGSGVDIGTNSTLTVVGGLRAASCTGGTVTAVPRVCDDATGKPDPGWASRAGVATDIFATATVPACTAGTVSFEPNRTYRDATALTQLTAGGCEGRTFHFPSGVYYFDFTNTGSHEWRINDPQAKVIGGVIAGTSGCDPQSGGVQFIFGGDSRVNIEDGRFAICALRTSSQQAIAVHGLRSASAPDAKSVAFGPTAAAGTGWTNPNGALPTGAGEAQAILGKGATATLTLSGLSGDFSALPTGSTIESVVATIRQRHPTGNPAQIEHITVTVRGANSANLGSADVELCPTNNVACTVSGSLSGPSDPGLLAQATAIEYVVKAKGGQTPTTWVDSVDITVTYRDPWIRPTSGCAAATGYPVEFSSDTAAICTVLRSSGNASVRVDGTVYLPAGAVNVQIPNSSEAGTPGPDDPALILRRGVVGRVLRVQVASGSQTLSPIQLPVPFPQCSDGIDNDGDGKIDYPLDPGCTSLTDDDETDAAPPQCNDGIDNDGDGKIDYPLDPGCTSLTDDDETDAAPPQCNDGIDNDGDGKIDYPLDPGCTSLTDDDETDAAPPQCNDGIDNDGDGKIDHPADPGCANPLDDDEADAATEVCWDDQDADGDGANNNGCEQIVVLKGTVEGRDRVVAFVRFVVGSPPEILSWHIPR